MNMIKIAALGLSAVLLALFLKEAHAPFSALVSLAACLLIVFYSVSRLSSVFELLDTLSGYVSAQKSYYKILLKIIGITYVADFSANLCRDAGYSAIAGQIEIFGKISILAVSSPIILALMETVYTFL
ncbi:MAG: stage III sporulation protein AD [Lachnospiraceae bacterium]|nr:stage III sporulation protein AD [Lachnospiraceae bacterium]